MCGDRLDVVLMRRRDSSLYQKQENLFLPQPDFTSVASASQYTSSCNSSLFAGDDGAENVIRQTGRWSHMTYARCCHGNDCHWHRQDLITHVQHAMLLRSKAPICLPVQDEWHQEFSVSGLLWCPPWLHNRGCGTVMVGGLSRDGRDTPKPRKNYDFLFLDMIVVQCWSRFPAFPWQWLVIESWTVFLFNNSFFSNPSAQKTK